MTNLEKFIEEQRVRKPSNADQATMQHLFLELARALNADLINKPVETTKEQPPLSTDLKIKLSNLMSAHVKLRNAEAIEDMDLYHAFLDWEKEVMRLIV